MYKIFADNTLIYDSTLEDYKIGKGSITLELNKSGSATFSLYPDHPFYDKIVKMKTVIIITKSEKIVFRGRVLNDVCDFWNNKVLTCGGELDFLQDSIIRPFSFTGTPEDLLKKFINEHNAQVDEFKRFKIGTVTVTDPNDYIARSNSAYESALSNMSSRLIGESFGGYFHITHGEDGKEETPTLNYLVDFTKVSPQTIEFGSNLKDYTKTVKADDIATAIIPLGAEVDDGDSETEDPRLTIASVNNGKDYVYSKEGVERYGWIFKTVEWDDVTDPNNLKKKAEEYLESLVNQQITVELNAIDLHLLDKSIESFTVGDYVRVISEPHNFTETLLCQKQTIDLLKPENDTIVLGRQTSSFVSMSVATSSAVSSGFGNIQSTITGLNKKTLSYHQVETQVTSLLAQSFGVFKSTEILPDGSSIVYLHDKPIRGESMTIWKMTADAFAVSTDGGNTWRAGMDSSGNAFLNILSVVGLEASWIHADNLSAISANLGGWIIDNEAIVKEVVDPSNSNLVYRVCFQPPKAENPDHTEVLSCRKSTDGGQTFTDAFTLTSDGSARFGNSTILTSDGTILWLSPDGEDYDGQITRQSDGTLALHIKHVSAESASFDYASMSDMSFGTVNSKERYTGSFNTQDWDGNYHTLRFFNGLLTEIN